MRDAADDAFDDGVTGGQLTNNYGVPDGADRTSDAGTKIHLGVAQVGVAGLDRGGQASQKSELLGLHLVG